MKRLFVTRASHDWFRRSNDSERKTCVHAITQKHIKPTVHICTSYTDVLVYTSIYYIEKKININAIITSLLHLIPSSYFFYQTNWLIGRSPFYESKPFHITSTFPYDLWLLSRTRSKAVDLIWLYHGKFSAVPCTIILTNRKCEDDVRR